MKVSYQCDACNDKINIEEFDSTIQIVSIISRPSVQDGETDNQIGTRKVEALKWCESCMTKARNAVDASV